MIRRAPRHERIAVDQEVIGGKRCITGTRIPIDLIVEKLGYGQSSEELLEAYPGLTLEGVRAAKTYARAVPDALLDAVVAHFDPLKAAAAPGARRARTATSTCWWCWTTTRPRPSSAGGRPSRRARTFTGRRHRAVSAALVRGHARGDRLARAHGRRGWHRGL